jgi:hypothetical protein
MVRCTFSLKAPVFLFIALSLGEVASASDAVTPQKEALKDVELSSFGVDEQGSSYRVDEQGRGRELGFFDVGFNWNMLMFHVGACHCSNENHHPLLCPPHYCDLRLPQDGPIPKEVIEYCECDCEEGWTWCGQYVNGAWVQNTESAAADEAAASDGTSSSSGENRSISGASVKYNWWMYAAGAAAVGMVAAAIIMRKRRNAEAEDELNGNASLSGAISRRAALLSGGAAVGAGAAMPQFLSVPSFRRNASGLEVDASGAVIEQSPSNYMEMDNHVDSSQLPSGVEVSSDGNLEPYHMGSMA